MKKLVLIMALLFSFSFVFGGCGKKQNGDNENSIFDFKTLSSTVPETEDAGYTYANNDNIKGIYFTGAEYNGEATKIFAYIGVPETEMPENGYPAMVLVHGGLGRAFPDWVKLWTDRGYVAISLSIDANITDANNTYPHTHNPQGGPGISINPTDMLNAENSWIYISVANIIKAHNLLRSMDVVDETNIGITGISWGSYLTCITIGVDNRFKFAIPVYGAGFNHEDYTSSLASVFAFDDATMEKYAKSFDPAAYTPYSNLPTLWICGANDHAFSLYCNQRSADLCKGEARFSWRASLTHGQQPGDGNGLPEIFDFANYIVKGEDDKLLRIDEGTFSEGVVTVNTQNSVGVKKAKLFWSENPAEYWHDSGNVWVEEEVTVNGSVLTATVPETAVFAFMQITDNNDKVVSSRLFNF